MLDHKYTLMLLVRESEHMDFVKAYIVNEF